MNFETFYDKVQVLGQGSFATVYKARLIPELRNNSRFQSYPEYVALKYIHLTNIDNSQNHIQEAQVLKSIKCPQIITCYDCFFSQDGQSLILSLEFLPFTLKSYYEAKKSTLKELK